MAKKPALVPVGSLLEDMSFFPRHTIDTTNVKHIADALQVGAELPPLVADKKTRTIIDGYHRSRAYLKLYGPEHEVAVDFRDYASRAAMFLDSVALNAGHGMPLCPADRTRCVALAEEFQVSAVEIARVLAIEVKQVEAIRLCKIGYEEGSGSPVALKRPFHHLAQHRLTPEQVDLNRASSGRDQIRVINDLVQWLEVDGALDRDNPRLMERLQVLHGLFEREFVRFSA